ncbi:Protein EXECUTER 2, chloroplastic [Porphyridium purpureum]|uniref:Protein EXECUTER 2, chloroplastic n=1 Tax=Porphyridium purpureum TaxID=35688 RepID=A0A5J4YZ90_PORPP|nr:Protein EXECUTER 2, chloroplastic [Porphyridium purpureum]|eukprot:POR5049..scf208_2
MNTNENRNAPRGLADLDDDALARIASQLPLRTLVELQCTARIFSNLLHPESLLWIKIARNALASCLIGSASAQNFDGGIRVADAVEALPLGQEHAAHPSQVMKIHSARRQAERGADRALAALSRRIAGARNIAHFVHAYMQPLEGWWGASTAPRGQLLRVRLDETGRLVAERAAIRYDASDRAEAAGLSAMNPHLVFDPVFAVEPYESSQSGSNSQDSSFMSEAVRLNLRLVWFERPHEGVDAQNNLLYCDSPPPPPSYINALAVAQARAVASEPPANLPLVIEHGGGHTDGESRKFTVTRPWSSPRAAHEVSQREGHEQGSTHGSSLSLNQEQPQSNVDLLAIQVATQLGPYTTAHLDLSATRAQVMERFVRYLQHGHVPVEYWPRQVIYRSVAPPAAGRRQRGESSNRNWRTGLLDNALCPCPRRAGLSWGLYGPHGAEFVELSRRVGFEGADGEFIVGTKVTGDPNVPAGHASFAARAEYVDDEAVFSGLRTALVELAHFHDEAHHVVHVHRCQGRVAQHGFQYPEWGPALLLCYGDSRMFGVLYAMDSFILEFHELEDDGAPEDSALEAGSLHGELA